ncbi:hypothetical protein XNC1_0948 [Xenorhabdus nematophila ATCC 19061]|uniref:Uncharacterized protein n=1 Tax=Xenorhabdus nematophila (strain ATCC 19061 / DSM 3370 / CCUG 14189 / LMG 1036 / NCIMB 9965 / AN6) TaxID=406817 RepID=D3VL60_XENNA|nr:hypothetical protein XNC1_0948 [Xenorhabdus nematophila ATCC 19061]
MTAIVYGMNDNHMQHFMEWSTKKPGGTSTACHSHSKDN